jgi:hypothetical protein
MSLTNKEKAKIQATNKALLNEYKTEVLNEIIGDLECYSGIKEHRLQKMVSTLFAYKNILDNCECNKATIDFIKQQIG